MELMKRETGLKDISSKTFVTQETVIVVTFYMGDFLLGITADKIVEINKDLEITPVPLADDYILGIMNLRGQIITVIDLAKKIGLKNKITPNLNLIIKTQDEAPISFVIEKIGDILEIPVSKLEKPPEKMEGIDKEYVEKIYQLPNKLLLLLNLEKIFKH